MADMDPIEAGQPWESPDGKRYVITMILWDHKVVEVARGEETRNVQIRILRRDWRRVLSDPLADYASRYGIKLKEPGSEEP